MPLKFSFLYNLTKKIKLPAFFQKKQITTPTRFGWILVLFCIFTITILPILKIHSFLAVSNPVNSKVLIVEGWVPDYCLEKAYRFYNIQPVNTIFITGGPLEQGSYLKEFKSFAALGAATLKKLGIPDSILNEVPAPSVQKDRTYTSAMALKTWLTLKNKQYSSVNILTLGIHARRSGILFKKALGNSTDVGIISITDRDYNPDTWYTSSCGLKMVITELISYLYTKASFSSQ